MQVSSLPRSESMPVLVNNGSLQRDPSHATCIVSTRSLKAEHDTTILWIPMYRSSCILSHFAHIFEVNDWHLYVKQQHHHSFTNSKKVTWHALQASMCSSVCSVQMCGS